METNAENTLAQEKEIYGSFFLNGSEFALSVSHVQEVINPPEKYTALPLAPSYLVGLLNLRGTIIPVVDLKEILKLKGDPAATERKIAILELQGHCIGLLFDGTGEIFRSSPEERSDFSDDENASVIRGVFKKDAGKRIVQILNVSALFDLQNIPKQDQTSQTRGRQALVNRRGLRKQCISFVVGPAKCALGIAEIQEILKIERVTESALAVNYCIGAIDLRGTTVPIIDFTAFLGYRNVDTTDQATQGSRRVVVMRIDQELFGLLVDAVDSIVTYYQEDLKGFPVISKNRSEMFIGCISLEGREDILLLDHRNILSNKEILEITHGHSRLFKTGVSKANDKKIGGARRTFITFAVESIYAIQIEEVKEIIDCPSTLLRPPGLPAHCVGVLNLRGDLVTIVDARIMYAQQKRERDMASKVLVFKKSNLHFGLIVDSVEGIVTFSDNNTVKLPALLYGGDSGGGLSQDVVEAIQIKDSKNQDKSMLILNSDSIAARFMKAA